MVPFVVACGKRATPPGCLPGLDAGPVAEQVPQVRALAEHTLRRGQGDAGELQEGRLALGDDGRLVHERPPHRLGSGSTCSDKPSTEPSATFRWVSRHVLLVVCAPYNASRRTDDSSYLPDAHRVARLHHRMQRRRGAFLLACASSSTSPGAGGAGGTRRGRHPYATAPTRTPCSEGGPRLRPPRQRPVWPRRPRAPLMARRAPRARADIDCDEGTFCVVVYGTCASASMIMGPGKGGHRPDGGACVPAPALPTTCAAPAPSTGLIPST